MLTTVFFIVLAGFFKSCADLMNHKFYESIFRNWNERFWCKDVSWKYAKRVFDYPIDGWHLANSGMIASFLAIPFTGFKPYYLELLPLWANVLLNYGAMGGLFVISFNLFYDKILRK